MTHILICRMYVKGVSALGESSDSNEVVIDLKTAAVPDSARSTTKSDKDDDDDAADSGRFQFLFHVCKCPHERPCIFLKPSTPSYSPSNAIQ